MNKTKKIDTTIFSKDFLWGASTAGHQVEGGNYDQWTVFELDNAAELARTAADRLRWLPKWHKFQAEAENPDNYVAGEGIDHYHRFEEDFGLLKKLRLNAFRFGIEWSRIEPKQGEWDEAAVAHYHKYIRLMKKMGIEPILNLWHWTHPVWFETLGGFSKKQNIKLFERFVKKIANEFSDEVTYILTVNEPNVYSSLGYFIGEWPPQKRNTIKYLLTYKNLAIAHNRAYAILKQKNPQLLIGSANQYGNHQPARKNNKFDIGMALVTEWFWQWWFAERTKHCIDFVGMNYYFTNYYKGIRQLNPPTPKNDLGWYMEPAGLSAVIEKAWQRYGKPVLVTENGVADADDAVRQWWLEQTMQALADAQHNGARVIGYLHWSLLDNFEWKYGWWPRFGLISVDRKNNMRRTIRPSALWWAKTLVKIKHDD
jgi:beta-glucosidase